MDSKITRMIRGMQKKEKASAKKSRKKKEKWFVYILECGDGSFYTGITNDLERRVKMHSDGKGAKYTRSHLPVTMVYSENCRGKIKAMVRECAVKAMPRSAKHKLIYAAG